MTAAVPRVLLLQIRDHPGAERQERECFVEFSGLPESAFRFHNVLAEPRVSWEETRAADAVIVGGAGAHSVTGDHEFTAPLVDLVRRLVAGRRPLFGSCFGHQFVAQALGGRVVTDLDRKEVGTHPIELTAAGRTDPLFAGLPERFDVQFGHHDRVVELPAGAVELAVSERCPNQAFRLEGLPVWGCQFHVELDDRRILERARIYQEGYLPGDDALARFAATLRPTPVASGLLRRFFAALG
jgi:GMP synthase (glutamine-hydrolysing)